MQKCPVKEPGGPLWARTGSTHGEAEQPAAGPPRSGELTLASVLKQGLYFKQPLRILGLEMPETQETLRAPEVRRAWRITVPHASREQVIACFAGYETLIGWEVSKEGQEHVHVMTVNEDKKDIDTIRKRIKALPLVGTPGYWSKINYKSYVFGISYTVKQKDYVTIGTWFSQELIDASVDAYARRTKVVAEELKCKDTDRDWQLTYTNLVRVCLNFAKENNIKTDDMKVVLKHLTHKTRWIPSPQMLKNGIDPWYFEIFKHRMNKSEITDTPEWWDRTPEVNYKRQRVADEK